MLKTRFEIIKEAVKKDDPKELARMMCDQYSDCDDCIANKAGYECYKGNNACLQWLNDKDD